MEMLREVMISFPPYEQQKILVEQIDALIDEAQHLESIYQQKLVALAELKQSLLQKAFSGELTAVKGAPTATLREEEVA
jgi:type I restriction enzyme S subunit